MARLVLGGARLVGRRLNRNLASGLTSIGLVVVVVERVPEVSSLDVDPDLESRHGEA